MKVVVQRVKHAQVEVDGRIVGKIDQGLLVLVGFTSGDQDDVLAKMAQKIAHLRIFDDENGVMNRSVIDVGGKILSVSQFTLYGNCDKGNRPSYIAALHGEEALPLYEQFNRYLAQYTNVETGTFGADMQVSFVNDGPVTILLER